MFCLLMITMPLSGCMDNSDDSTSEEDNVELQDWHVHFAVNAADLPTCNEDTNGRLYYVESDNEFQVCKSTGWEIISIKGADGVDGNIGEKGDQGIPGPDGKTTLVNILSSTNCENDGYTFEIGTDANIDGVLTSDEVTLTTEVCNGKNGINGSDGQDGAPGVDGTDGVDGVQGPMGPQGPQGPAGNDGANGVDGQDGAPGVDGTDGAQGPTGPQGPQGPAGNDGADGTDGAQGPTGPQGPQGPAGNDGADGTDGAQGPTGPQGPQGPAGNDGADGTDGVDGQAQGPQGPAGNDGMEPDQGPTGPDGADGNDGYDILVTTNSIIPGDIDCTDGGIEIQIGADTNENSVLDQNEITTVEKICNGEGRNSMVSTSNILSGDIDCPDGGTELAIGVDYDDNGVLDPWEVGTYEKICNGEGRNSMVSTSNILSGDIDCPDGGTELAIGVDYDDNGVLDPWEVGTYEKICNGEGRNSMVSTSNILSGDIDCPDGGTELAIGVDYDDNGVLDPWEVGTYEKICNGEEEIAWLVPPIYYLET